MLKKKTSNLELPPEVAQPSLSVATVFVIAGVLFLVLVYALYFFRYNSASPFYDYFNKPAVPTVTLNNSIQTGINKAASGKQVEIKLTENQIAAAACVSCDSFPLRKGALQVKPTGIVISGKTTTAFWGVGLEATLMPKVKDGKLSFDLTDFKAAGVTAPPSITKSYNSQIQNLFTNLIPSTQSINVTEVHSLVGSLLIIGTKK